MCPVSAPLECRPTSVITRARGRFYSAHHDHWSNLILVSHTFGPRSWFRHRGQAVAHEVGAAASSGKPLVVLVDQRLAEKPMGLLADVEQVRFDRDNLAASTAAITTGIVRLGEKRGVAVEPASIVTPTQPALFSVSVQMNAQFQVTPDQVLVGVAAFMLISGLIYLASLERGA